MDYKELTEIGWGIYKDTEGNKWVATEEYEVMNMETGEIEKVERGEEDER